MDERPTPETDAIVHKYLGNEGVRECVRLDHNPHWMTAAWDDNPDAWVTTENDQPTHWMPMPSGPATIEKANQ